MVRLQTSLVSLWKEIPLLSKKLADFCRSVVSKYLS